MRTSQTRQKLISKTINNMAQQESQITFFLTL